MKKITFVPIEYGCNDNCISCPVPRQGERENPSFKDVKESIDKIAQYSNHIEFNGGEPTLNKDLFKILKYAEIKGFKEIGLLSNVKLFYYEKYVKLLSTIKNIKIITTIYGHNEKIQDAITRTPNSFKYKFGALKNLTKYEIPIELRILIHKMNYEYFEDISKFIIENFQKDNFMKVVVMYPKLTVAAYKNKNVVSERMSIVSKYMISGVEKLSENGYNVVLYHFPHCVIDKKIWKNSGEMTAIDGEMTFLETCEECIMKSKCSGIWRSYLSIYDDKEFKPIKNED